MWVPSACSTQSRCVNRIEGRSMAKERLLGLRNLLEAQRLRQKPGLCGDVVACGGAVAALLPIFSSICIPLLECGPEGEGGEGGGGVV
jgi:hypothetical protein